MKRIDSLLVEQGRAASRAQAQQWIEAGRVRREGDADPIRKASQKFPESTVFEIAPDPADRFVSRGGLKLQGAIKQTGLAVAGRLCLDIGISTGGFTDCLLQHGAQLVVGVDVGHSQLAARLAADPRVVLLENINARYLQAADVLAYTGGQPVEVIVVDVSFISLTLVLPAALETLAANGELLALVKPQFEVGREGLGKGGIVRDESRYAEVEAKIRAFCHEAGLHVLHYLDSPIKGGDGNREFFVHARRANA